MDNAAFTYWVATFVIGLVLFNPFMSKATKPSEKPYAVEMVGPTTITIPAGKSATIYVSNSSFDDLPPEGAKCEVEYQSIMSKDGIHAAKCLQGKWKILTFPKDQ